jgi:hypothetical protein
MVNTQHTCQDGAGDRQVQEATVALKSLGGDTSHQTEIPLCSQVVPMDDKPFDNTNEESVVCTTATGLVLGEVFQKEDIICRQLSRRIKNNDEGGPLPYSADGHLPELGCISKEDNK